MARNLKEFFLHEIKAKRSSTNIEINVEGEHPLSRSARSGGVSGFDEWFAQAQDVGDETFAAFPSDELRAAAQAAFRQGEDPATFAAQYSGMSTDVEDLASRRFGVDDPVEPESFGDEEHPILPHEGEEGSSEPMSFEDGGATEYKGGEREDSMLFDDVQESAETPDEKDHGVCANKSGKKTPEVQPDPWGYTFVEHEDPTINPHTNGSYWSEPTAHEKHSPKLNAKSGASKNSEKAWKSMRKDGPEQPEKQNKVKDFFGGQIGTRLDEAPEDGPGDEWKETTDDDWDNPFGDETEGTGGVEEPTPPTEPFAEDEPSDEFTLEPKGEDETVDLSQFFAARGGEPAVRDEDEPVRDLEDREDDEKVSGDKLDAAVSGIEVGGDMPNYCSWCGEDFAGGKPGEVEDGEGYCNDSCLAQARNDAKASRKAAMGSSKYADVPRQDISLLGSEEPESVTGKRQSSRFDRLGRMGLDDDEG